MLGISKVIFGEGGINKSSIVDMDGEYRMTNGALAIKVDTKKEAEGVKKALDSDKFNKFIKSCCWSIYRIEWRVFRYLRKDFYKEFI